MRTFSCLSAWYWCQVAFYHLPLCSDPSAGHAISNGSAWHLTDSQKKSLSNRLDPRTWKTVTSDHKSVLKFLRSQWQRTLASRRSAQSHGVPSGCSQNLPPNNVIPSTLQARQHANINSRAGAHTERSRSDGPLNSYWPHSWVTRNDRLSSHVHGTLKLDGKGLKCKQEDIGIWSEVHDNDSELMGWSFLFWDVCCGQAAKLASQQPFGCFRVSHHFWECRFKEISRSAEDYGAVNKMQQYPQK